MKFKQYLTENSRAKALEDEDAYALVKKHCKKAYNAYLKGWAIYRGIKYPINYHMFIDPSKSTRKSANTSNYYTLLVDNNPLWKDYPKRSQSIICTNSQRKTLGFGEMFVVLPYDGSRMGVAPEHDFWFSFEKTLGFGNSLNYFNMKLDALGDSLGVNISKYAKNWSSFKKGIKEIESMIEKDGASLGMLSKTIPPFKMTQNKDDLLENIFSLLDPKKNGFKVTTNPTQLPKEAQGLGQEIWTDGKSILIDMFSWQNLQNFMEGK